MKEEKDINDKLVSILINAAVSVENVDKIVVVKTLTDQLWLLQKLLINF